MGQRNWSLNITLEDGKGEKSVSSVWLPEAMTAAELQEWSDFYIEELDEITGCLVVSASISLELTTTGAKVLADKAATHPISDVEEGAIMRYSSTNQFPFRHRIPGFFEGKLVTGTVDVDDADADVVDYTDAIISGFTLATTNTFAAVEHRGEDLTVFDGGVENFTRSR